MYRCISGCRGRPAQERGQRIPAGDLAPVRPPKNGLDGPPVKAPGDAGNLRSAVLLGAELGRPRLREEDVFTEPLHRLQCGGGRRQGGSGHDSAVLGEQVEDVLDGGRVLLEPDGELNPVRCVRSRGRTHGAAGSASGASASARRPRSTAASSANARWCST